MSDEIASGGDRDVFREVFWADRGCSLHNVRARQHSGWLADTPSSPALDAPQSEGTAVRARAGWSVLRRPRHPKIRARFDQLFSGFPKKPTFIPEVSKRRELSTASRNVSCRFYSATFPVGTCPPDCPTICPARVRTPRAASRRIARDSSRSPWLRTRPLHLQAQQATARGRRQYIMRI